MKKEPPLSISGIAGVPYQIFPNPAIDHIAVSIPDHIPNATITLYDQERTGDLEYQGCIEQEHPLLPVFARAANRHVFLQLFRKQQDLYL